MHISPLDPNGVAVCPSGFDCVRYALSAQDDNQAFVFRIRYNGNNGRFVNRPYEMTKVSGSIGDGGSKPPPYGKTVRLIPPDVILNEVTVNDGFVGLC